MSDSNSRQRSIWLIALALIILALIPFAVHRASQKRETNRSAYKNKKTIRTSFTSQESSAQRSERSSSEKLPPSHQTDDLQSFLLPPSKLSNVTLEETLDHLFSQYREICQETRESPISFRYKIEGASEQIVSAKIQGDFLANLKYLAAMAGMTLEVEDHNLLFTEIEDGPIVQRRWTVPSTFQSWLPHLPEIPSQDDPFGGVVTPPPADIETLLQNIGVMGDEGTVSFLRSSSTLIARAGSKSMQRIDGLVETAVASRPIQTRLRFFEEEKHPLSLVLLPGNIGSIERSFSSPTEGPNMQVLATAVEQGFGRRIQTVSFTGEDPTEEAKALYLESGNIADLGVSENLAYATYNLTRSEEGEPQTFSFKDENGALHQKTFIAERIDATGRVITVPNK